MAAYQGMLGFKKNNERKTVLLLILFPILLFLVSFLLILFFGTESAPINNVRLNQALLATEEIFIILLPIILIRGVIVFFFQKQIMFSFSGAKEITRKDHPEVYNIVENLSISCGLTTPKIGIIPSPGLNAFATGWREKDSWIVFTSGLLETLDKREIEAVAAHELSHLINKDSMLMLVTVVFIGIISILGEILIRNSSKNSDNKGNFLPLIGLGFLLLGYLVYPLMKLAVSRKREFLADLGSVELTKDTQAMISALQKISGNSVVKQANQNMAMFFIESPKSGDKSTQKMKRSSLRDSHPSIEERINALNQF